MSLILYYAPGACSGVTINAVEELGLKCEYRKVDLAAGEQKTAEYLKVNPYGKVPALIVDGKLLTENPAILIYLNSLVPGSKLIPTPEDAFHESLLHSDLMWLSSSVHPSVRHVCMPSFYTVSSDVNDVVEKGRTALKVYFDIAENRLTESNYWYGKQCSIFDIYLHWCYTRALRGGYPLDDFPALLAHQQLIECKLSFKKRKVIENS
jgi:glutathione S-transferase